MAAQDSKGNKVAGMLAADGSSWASSGTLNISSSYTVTGKALDSTGAEKNISAKFTTLTPAKRLGLQSYFPNNNETVGVGQPISVNFTNPPNSKDRANVEKAMTVTTTPHVDGAWSWITATQADWRPQSYWESGTKVAVQMNLNGVQAPAMRPSAPSRRASTSRSAATSGRWWTRRTTPCTSTRTARTSRRSPPTPA